MNLQSKRARVPIAALGVSALICGAGAVVSPANAVGETLTFLGADNNSATIVNSDPTATGTAGAAFGVKVGGAPSGDTRDLVLEVLSAPTGGAVWAEHVSSNGDPAANATGSAIVPTGTNTAGSSTLTLSVANGSDLTGRVIKIGSDLAVVASGGAGTTLTLDRPLVSAHTAAAVTNVSASSTSNFLPTVSGTTDKVYNYSLGDNVYFGATTAGAYTFRLFKDTAGDGTYQANADDATPTFTLTSKSVTDAFALTVPSTVDTGTKAAKATVTSTVTKTDIRGGTPATLATTIAGLLNFDFTDNGSGPGGVTGENSDGVGTYSDANGYFRYLNAGVAGATPLAQDSGTPKTLSTAVDFSGTSIGAAKTTEVTTNGVTAVALAVGDGQTDDVKNSAGTVSIRPGVGEVVYTAKATTGGTGQASKTVTFTLTGTGGVALTDLTANGAAVPSSGVVTATTDADGFAALKVVSTKTANGNGYQVKADSGTATTATINASYATALASQIEITSSSAELTPTVGTASVTVKGAVLDQFGEKFQPPSSDSQQVAVTGAATGNAVLTGGDFSYTYTPTTTPTAGSTASLTFTYDNAAAPDPSAVATIQWASTTAAAKITLATPVNDAKAVNLLGYSVAPTATQGNAGSPAFGNTTGAVNATVFDASNATLSFKTVTLSGSPGVLFATAATPDATHKLTKTLDVVTNSSGAITGAFVFFTEAGEATITATSGTATASAKVTTSPVGSGQGYHISVDDVQAMPGATVIVTGKVNDAFDNPVPNALVLLSTGTSTVGALGSGYVYTNSDGIFSTTFIAGSNKSGEVELTATIDGLTADPTVNAAYATAGITIAKGNYQDIGKITVAETKLTLTATAKISGSGSASVGGDYLPNTSVDIYSKPSGSDSYTLLDSLQTDAEGDFGGKYAIKKTTYFLAKANGMSSPSDKTEVWSTVSLTGKSKSHNRATLSANGAPSAKGTLTFYRSMAGKDPILRTVTSNTSGNATVTVKLPKGTRTVYAVFKAPGTGAGTSKSIKVKVK